MKAANPSKANKLPKINFANPALETTARIRDIAIMDIANAPRNSILFCICSFLTASLAFSKS